MPKGDEKKRKRNKPDKRVGVIREASGKSGKEDKSETEVSNKTFALRLGTLSNALALVSRLSLSSTHALLPSQTVRPKPTTATFNANERNASSTGTMTSLNREQVRRYSVLDRNKSEEQAKDTGHSERRKERKRWMAVDTTVWLFTFPPLHSRRLKRYFLKEGK